MQKGQKSLIAYVVVMLVLMMLLNSFLLPLMMRAQIETIDYGRFVSMLEAGEVQEVSITQTEITILGKAAEGERAKTYITGVVDDPGLIERLLKADITFTGDLADPQESLLSVIISWLLPLGIMFGGYMLLSRSMQKHSGQAMTFGKTTAKIYAENKTGKTFGDVAGQEEALESLKEIVDFLHNPKKYTDIGAKLPKGALLVGPPGTGKTLLAKAVAGESGVPFFSLSGSDFVEMFVGVGASRVRDLFKQASDKAPCIVFIDEIDAIGKSRDGKNAMGGNDEREQTLNQLLGEMDGFDPSKGVIILAATNRPEVLDKALLRPGRFDRRIIVSAPDLKGRTAILGLHARGVRMAEGINLGAVARATAGASGADLANIVNEAALMAVRNGREEVAQADLYEAVEMVVAGAQRKSSVLSPQEKRLVAYHEMGHALVAARTPGSEPVHKITIVPRTSGALGYTMQVAERERSLLTRDEVVARITGLLGGRAAEEALGMVTTGASNDIEQATRMARAMVTQYGMTDRFDMMGLEEASNRYLEPSLSFNGSPQTASDVDAEVLGIIRECHERARGIVGKETALLGRLADVLLEKETMDGDEFARMLGGEGGSELLLSAYEVAGGLA